MNKKLIIILSIYLIIVSAMSLVVVSDISETDKTTEDKVEITNAIFLSSSKTPGTIFQRRGGVIRVLMLK